MSIILIKQYLATDDTQDKKEENEALQAAFLDDGANSVIVPSGLDVQWLPAIGSKNIAVIKAYGDTEVIKNGADQLKKDLAENGISATILPSNTDVEILHVL